MSSRVTGSMDPARRIFTIQPNDDEDITPRPKALWVNDACTLVVMGDDDQVGTIVMAGAGPVPFSPKRLLTSSDLPSPDTVKGLWG